MITLSLFDGISGGHVALKNLGINTHYFSSEIDKFAVSISSYNHKQHRLGDVKSIVWDTLPKIDLLIAGFPCTDLSISKENRQGLKGPQSSLFYKIIEAIDKCKPKYFLIENVSSMPVSCKDTISNMLGVQPVRINSSQFTAQLRDRLYWCNFPVEITGTKDCKLQDILESGIADREKSYCIDACYYKGGNHRMYYQSGRRQMVHEELNQEKILRTLTPLECERLQGFPDNYTAYGKFDIVKPISKTQRYKTLGNSFTVPVIECILKNLGK